MGLEAGGSIGNRDQSESCHGPRRHGKNWMNSAAGTESGCVWELQEDGGMESAGRGGAAGEAAGGLGLCQPLPHPLAAHRLLPRVSWPLTASAGVACSSTGRKSGGGAPPPPHPSGGQPEPCSGGLVRSEGGARPQQQCPSVLPDSFPRQVSPSPQVLRSSPERQEAGKWGELLPTVRLGCGHWA